MAKKILCLVKHQCSWGVSTNVLDLSLHQKRNVKNIPSALEVSNISKLGFDEVVVISYKSCWRYGLSNSFCITLLRKQGFCYICSRRFLSAQ